MIHACNAFNSHSGSPCWQDNSICPSFSTLCIFDMLMRYLLSWSAHIANLTYKHFSVGNQLQICVFQPLFTNHWWLKFVFKEPHRIDTQSLIVHSNFQLIFLKMHIWILVCSFLINKYQPPKHCFGKVKLIKQLEYSFWNKEVDSPNTCALTNWSS